jgi:hypothetical protein
MLVVFPEVNFLATGGAEVQLSDVGKKVRVDILHFISERRVISQVKQKESVWRVGSEIGVSQMADQPRQLIDCIN